jgi:CHAT domain-containing protein
MSNLGDRLLEDGEVSRARSLFRKALAIQTQHLRPDHRYRIQSLLGLAAASRSLDEHDDARRLAREALAAVEQSQSPEDLEAARALTALAETEVDAGNAAAAVPSLERALAMIERVLGDGAFRSEHPRAVLAEALRRLEDGRCLSEALESERVAREHLRRTIRVLPERQALSWRGSVRRGLDLALTCLASTPGRSDSAVAAVWDAVVRSRGLVLDELVSRLHFDPGADTAVHRLANAFVVARRREVNLAVRGPRNESESEFRATLVDAAREADEAEAALARRSAAYRTRFERGAIGLAEVKAARPANAALVSYIRYQSPRLPSLEAPPETVAGRHPAGDHYAAFVLRNDAGPPMFVPLGTAGEIDSLVARWHIAARSQAPDEANYRRVAGALRARAWDPIARHLEDAPVVCLTPDDALALVNFDTLPLGARGYLIERGPLVLYLTMERDLVAGPRAPGVGGHLLAVGGVDYDAEPGAPRAASPSPASTPGSSSRGAGVGCAVLDSMRFVALPQSRAEIEDVRELWARSAPGRRVRALSGSAATEEAFRANAPTCRVLHLATHGFFIDGDCNPAPAGPDAGVIDGTAEDADLPLVRSGLALAGANGRRRTAIAADDGILTAAEVATLDLDAVEGVVLSGCETGLGAPANLEGLIGLRRAFQVAGAKTLVMSLWGVEDAPARRWVRTFYETLTRGRSSHVAVRDASRALLAAQRAAGLGGHPAAWGAFTSCGTR